MPIKRCTVRYRKHGTKYHVHVPKGVVWTVSNCSVKAALPTGLQGVKVVAASFQIAICV